MNRLAYTDEQKSDLLKMYNGGAALSEISERFGCCAGYVRKLVKSFGGTLRPHGGSRPPKRKSSMTLGLCKSPDRKMPKKDNDDELTPEERQIIKDFVC